MVFDKLGLQVLVERLVERIADDDLSGFRFAAGVLIAWAALPGVDSGREEKEPQPLLDFRPALANRDVLALMFGYAAAIWAASDCASGLSSS